MPNFENICRPISIFGIGRSGTTLLTNLIASVNWIQNCNETMGLIYGAWSGGIFSEFSFDRLNVGQSKKDFCVLAVHGALITAMKSEKQGWVQKLSGIPNNFVWGAHITDNDLALFNDIYPFPFELYCDVIDSCFPYSINLLIARNPLEIAVSRQHFSGWKREDILTDMAVAFRIFSLIKNKFSFVVRYSILKTADPEYTKMIFDAIGVEYRRNAINVYKNKYAPSMNKYQLDFGDPSQINLYLKKAPLSPGETNSLIHIANSFKALGLEEEYPPYLPKD